MTYAVGELQQGGPGDAVPVFAGLAFDAADPDRMGRFWAGVLGSQLTTPAERKGERVLVPKGAAYRITFCQSQTPKLGPG